VVDAGNFLGVVPYLSVPDLGCYKMIGEFTSIGLGFGAALGVALSDCQLRALLDVNPHAGHRAAGAVHHERPSNSPREQGAARVEKGSACAPQRASRPSRLFGSAHRWRCSATTPRSRAGRARTAVRELATQYERRQSKCRSLIRRSAGKHLFCIDFSGLRVWPVATSPWFIFVVLDGGPYIVGRIALVCSWHSFAQGSVDGSRRVPHTSANRRTSVAQNAGQQRDPLLQGGKRSSPRMISRPHPPSALIAFKAANEHALDPTNVVLRGVTRSKQGADEPAHRKNLI
jgi:hypothetical protein